MEMIRIETPSELDMPIGETMFTQRAIRRLDPHRPIPDAHLKIILDAASKAPSGGNTQPARFLVARNKDRIREFGKLYHEAWWRSAATSSIGRARTTFRRARFISCRHGLPTRSWMRRWSFSLCRSEGSRRLTRYFHPCRISCSRRSGSDRC